MTLAGAKGSVRARGDRPLRLLYAVHGYGLGHATRSTAMVSALAPRYQILVLAGGDAYPALARECRQAAHWQLNRIPSLGYAYGAKSGRRSNLATLAHNAGAVLDLVLGGAVYRMVAEVMREFAPDVVISDAEVWSARAARGQGVPRISFDHFGILAHCHPDLDPLDRLEAKFDALVYRTLMGRAERALVSSFFPARTRSASVHVVPTLVRRAVLEARPSDAGHLLVYLNQGRHQFDPRLRAALQGLGRRVLVYGTGQQGRDGWLEHRLPGDANFVQDLASCHAVVSTAGNQLVGEAMWLAKPMLVMPEDCVEQRMNARAVQSLGIGQRAARQQVDVTVLRAWLQEHKAYAERMRALRSDGLAESLRAIEGFIAELSGAALSLASPSACGPAPVLTGNAPAWP